MAEIFSVEGHIQAEQMEAAPSVFRYEGEYSDYLVRLQDVLTVSGEHKATIENLIDDASNKVCSLLVDDGQQNAVAQVASAYKWLLAASPHQELPPSLIVTAAVDDDNSPTYLVRSDERNPLLTYVEPVERKLYQNGLRDAEEYKANLLGQRQDDIAEILSDYARVSAASRFIQSFEQPPQSTADTPLTPFWRQVRQMHIEDSLRKRHGMDDQEEFMPGTNARRELGRLLLLLDDETMPNPSAGPQSGIERFEAYALHLLLDELQKYGLTLVRLETDIGEDEDEPYHYVEVYTRDKDGDVTGDMYIDEIIMDMLSAVMRDAGVDENNPLCGTDQNIIYEALRNVLYPKLRPNFRTLDELLTQSYNEAVATTASRLIELGIEGAGSSWSSKTYNTARYMEPTYRHGLYDNTELNALVNKQRKYPGPLYKYWVNVFESGGATISSRESQERQHQRTFGYVEQPNLERQVPMRLILPGNNDLLETLPRGVSPYDLKLTIAYGQEHTWQHHYIPGYQLIGMDTDSYSRERYFYVLDASGDPYARCDVEAPTNKLDELLVYYESIGINTAPLLPVVRAGATVQNVVQGIRAVSDYIYADDEEAANMASKFNIGTHYYADPPFFNKLVRNGRLQVQCSGAATFLNHSLGLLFGEGCSRTISGDVIVAGESRIDGVGHAQVLFHNNGLQFILDATPASNDPRDGRRHGTLGSIGTELRNNSMTPRKVSPNNQPSEQKREYGLVGTPLIAPEIVIPEKPADEKVQELVGRLKGMLRVFNDSKNDDELFQKLIKLPETDPMRTTLQTILTNEGGNTPKAAPDAVLSYLESCIAADGEARRGVGIESYADAMLEQLAGYMRQYVALRSHPKKVGTKGL